MRFSSALVLFSLGLTAWVSVGCNSSTTTSGSSGSSSSSSVQLLATDGAFPYKFVAHANVTFDKVELKKDDNDTKVVDMLQSPVTIDFVQLRNGLTNLLSKISVPAGQYKQINFSVASASIDLVNGNHFNMTIPSGVIKAKIKPYLNVVTSVSTDLILDVDLSQSFVAQCGSNTDCDADPDLLIDVTGFNFKPHLRLVNNTSAGTVQGTIQSILNGTTSGLEGALVTLTHNDADPTDPDAVCTTDAYGNTTCTETLHAVTDANGFFKVIGVLADSYSVTVTHANLPDPTNLDPNQYDSWSTLSTNVNVFAGNISTLNGTLAETVNP